MTTRSRIQAVVRADRQEFRAESNPSLRSHASRLAAATHSSRPSIRSSQVVSAPNTCRARHTTSSLSASAHPRVGPAVSRTPTISGPATVIRSWMGRVGDLLPTAMGGRFRH